MKNARRRLSARYLAALRIHLDKKCPGNGDRAQGLGRAALAAGLLTLDLAIVHEKAVVALASSYDFANTRNGAIKRAGLFFTQALIPLEAAHRATRETISQLNQHNKTLRRLTAALARGTSVGLDSLRAKIARTQRLVEDSVNSVHRFARELRPAALDDLGLIPALHAYSKSVAARKRFKIQLTAFGGVEALGSAERTVLYRVAQEALTNVVRHAQATQVRISISEISGAIRMEIGDNGKSFHVGKALLTGNPKRLGLIGMKERVEMVGGSLTIKSAPGTGTTVRAEIPFDREQTKI